MPRHDSAMPQGTPSQKRLRISEPNDRSCVFMLCALDSIQSVRLFKIGSQMCVGT